MRKNYTNSDRVMFKIDVKIGQRILTLNVCQNDTIEGLLVKNQIASQSDHQRLNELKEKIKLNIRKQIQIKLYSNQFDLAQRMQKFLVKENQQDSLQTQKIDLQYDKDEKHDKQTPFKLLFENTQKFNNINPNSCADKNNQKFIASNEKNYHDNSSYSQLKQSTGPINEIIHLQPKRRNLNNSKKKKDYSRYSQSNNKGSVRKVDDDLIRAYQIILKKSKDKTMRQMAEKTLKELNVYKPQPHCGQFNLREYLDDKNKDENVKQMDLEQLNREQEAMNQNIDTRMIDIERISRSRSLMRKNYKYSYLGENINLTHEYEKSDKQKGKKQFSYLNGEQISGETIKKQYNKQGAQQGNIVLQPVARRFNYLSD